jgi:hypothetical protein
MVMPCSAFDGEAHVVSEEGKDSVGDGTSVDMLYTLFSVKYVCQWVQKAATSIFFGGPIYVRKELLVVWVELSCLHSPW